MDQERKMAEYEAQAIHGTINLNMTRPLVIVLIGRIYRAGMVTREFANQVFDDAAINMAAAQRALGECGSNHLLLVLGTQASPQQRNHSPFPKLG